MEEIKYPKILSNVPEGRDSFKSKSHQNISKTIATLIQNQGSIIKKQILGLEGDWGTGKSNIVKILETELGDKYYHFTYDTWTHQEDLTRKSILQELIVFLKSGNTKIIDSENDAWKQKENELSQKVLSKNTEVFPKIKIYYILFFLAFVIIKFGNEVSKQIIGGKAFGFYDNSFSYLIDNFFLKPEIPFTFEYFVKLFPFLLLIGGFCDFIYSFCEEFSLNEEKSLDKRLSISQLLGKQFYWVSGEKSESFSREKINEKEPSNQMFRSFLKDIDDELKDKEKKLVFTIDNTDRLSGSKLKNIWSTINIFFAESNNDTFLENIWLIIPYDEKRIILSMEDGGAIGLLEKTFAITFKVTPPLLSNWESFFDECFETAFKEIEINDKKEEIQLLKRIFESYESNITPRKIINFINQISTYYIQNTEIKLRYNAIFELTKNELLEGDINKNIIDREKYLENLDTIFIGDDQLEINISKIIYGISNNEEAEEALLVNSIENILTGKNILNESILKIPSFIIYFNKVFRNFVDKNHDSKLDRKVIENLTRVLIELDESYYSNNNFHLYKSLWQKYSTLILSKNINYFDDTYKNIIKHCERETVKKIISNGVNSVIGRDPLPDRLKIEKEYITFLESLNKYIEIDKNYIINDFFLLNRKISPEIFLPYLKESPQKVKEFKLITNDDELGLFFKKGNQKADYELVVKYKNELVRLNEGNKLAFLINDLNSFWITKEFISVENVQVLLFFYKNLKNKNEIRINSLNNQAYSSLVNLIKKNLDKPNILAELYQLFIINYNDTPIIELDYNVLMILSVEDTGFLNDLKKGINALPFTSGFVKLLRMAVKTKNSNLNVLKNISESILDLDLEIDNNSFNWILKEYSNLQNYIFGYTTDGLYNFIKKYFVDKDIDILNLDVNLIGKDKNEFNNKLVMISNEYLRQNIINHPKLLQNINLLEYKLLFKLLDTNSLNNDLSSILYEPLKNATLSTTLVDDFRFKNILKIKKNLNNDDLEKLVEYALANPLRKGIIYLIPEILYKFYILNDMQRNTISHLITLEKSYYTNELIDFLIKNKNDDLEKKVIKNLETIPNSDVFKYAKTVSFI